MSLSKLLTREQRATVLQRCLHNRILLYRCYRYHKLLSMDHADLVEELAVHMYKGLFYFRHSSRYANGPDDPMTQAYKLAVTTGHNKLTSMVRTALKRGHFSVQDIDVTTLVSREMTNASLKEVMGTLATVATTLVGEQRAGALIQATVYDWDRHRGQAMLVAQQKIIKALGLRQRKDVAKLLEQFYQATRKQLGSTDQVPLRRLNGVWRAAEGTTNKED